MDLSREEELEIKIHSLETQLVNVQLDVARANLRLNRAKDQLQSKRDLLEEAQMKLHAEKKYNAELQKLLLNTRISMPKNHYYPLGMISWIKVDHTLKLHQMGRDKLTEYIDKKFEETLVKEWSNND